jgi:hypothetical protein
MQHYYIEDLFQFELPCHAGISRHSLAHSALETAPQNRPVPAPASAFMRQVSQYEFAIRTTACDCAGEKFHVHYAKPENIPLYLKVMDQQIVDAADIWDCITLYKNLLIVHPFVDGNGR